VSTANKMESSGRAGWVHISHATYEQIHTEYTFENAEKQSGYSTYFVVPDERRKLKMPTVADALLANPATLIGTQISMQSNDSTVSLQVNTPSPNNDDNESSDTNESDPNKSAIAIVEQQPANKQETLIKAIHDIEFFRPNLNVFTLFFNNRLEQEYKNFLIGYKATPANNDTMANKFDDDCAFSQLLEKNSVKFWSNPPNTLFSSLFISFLINFAVSLAYLLSYIASEGEFKNTDKIFIKILVPFLIINITQLVFLLIYFYKFTTFFKQNKHQTTLFTFEDSSGTQGNTTIVAKHAQQQHHQQQPVAYMKTISKTAESKQRIRNTHLKMVLLYLTSFIFVSIVPVYMLTNGLSVVCHFVRTHGASTSSSTKSPSPHTLNMFLVYYSITYVISLVNICVFVQLNKLFKHFLIFLFTFFYFLFMFYLNFELCNRVLTPQHDVTMDNVTVSTNMGGLDWLGGVLWPPASTDSPVGYYNLLNRNYILVLDFLLYLIFLYIINRQFEIVNRLAFVCDQDSTKQTKTNNEQKELANWLIDVVLPAHVVEHVQARKQYSRNYDCVGVLFVSLCNYSEFYEEKFLGGRELIRILNEITVDFDRLFDDPKYQNIEKIKNIGSTFMIASGLCPTTSYNDDDDEVNSSPNKNTRDKHQHLYDLIEFALNLWQKLETFNNDAMSVCHFQFQMRMGFNFGPVTAGVIGEERLLYDIWGDTVNVASRMDSTGQAGVLQAPESAASFLSNKYIFHHRGEIQVKGKDKMITYFLKPKENENLSGHCGGALLPE
jgi:class 3 adenylate cyclase